MQKWWGKKAIKFGQCRRGMFNKVKQTHFRPHVARATFHRLASCCSFALCLSCKKGVSFCHPFAVSFAFSDSPFLSLSLSLCFSVRWRDKVNFGAQTRVIKCNNRAEVATRAHQMQWQPSPSPLASFNGMCQCGSMCVSV